MLAIDNQSLKASLLAFLIQSLQVLSLYLLLVWEHFYGATAYNPVSQFSSRAEAAPRGSLGPSPSLDNQSVFELEHHPTLDASYLRLDFSSKRINCDVLVTKILARGYL